MKGPVFIIGAPRSGTTLLRLILNAHPLVAIPHECNLIYRVLRACPDPTIPVKNLDRFVDRLVQTPRFSAVFGIDRERVIRSLASVVRPTSPNLLGCLYKLSQGYDPPAAQVRWGDKYIGLCDYVWEVAAYFQDSQFVHLIRDPRDSVASIMQKFPIYRSLHGRWYCSGDPVGASQLYRDMTLRSCQYAGRLGPSRYLLVRYEQLVRNPVLTVQAICAFLGLPFENSMLDYYRHVYDPGVIPADSLVKYHENVARPLTTSLIGSASRSLSKKNMAIVETICGDIIARYGYPVQNGESNTVLFCFKKSCAVVLYRAVYFLKCLAFRLKNSLSGRVGNSLFAWLHVAWRKPSLL